MFIQIFNHLTKKYYYYITINNKYIKQINYEN